LYDLATLDEDIEVNHELDLLKRSMSFENERGCDEIMQQFIHGLDD